MSAEHSAPAYETRTFYGPLELHPSIEQTSNRQIFTHPSDPSKLVRVPNAADLYVKPRGNAYKRIHNSTST